MLKEKINQKLKSEKGTSIFFGLLLFLVASVVSVVILEGAVTTVKRVESDRKAEQNYLTCSSAAKLLRDEIVNSKVAQITTVTTKNNKSEVTDTKWRGVAASSDSVNGTEDLFASFLQPYIEEYSGRTGTAATGAYTKKFTVSVPSNIENQKEKEEFGETEAEMTVEDSKNGDEADGGFDISIKLVTGSGSDTCRMLLRLSGKLSLEKIEKTTTDTSTTITTKTVSYTWEPLKITYGDKEVNLEE